MKDDANVVLLKRTNKLDGSYRSVYKTVDEFNDNYHKYVSNEDNEYFVIPVSNIDNLFVIFDRKSMPQIYVKRSIFYTIEVLKQSRDSIPQKVYSKEICVNLEKPHCLFTFIYNLIELGIFNHLFNVKSGNDDIYAYTVTSYHTTDGISKDSIGISDFIDDIFSIYNIENNRRQKIENKFYIISDDHISYVMNSIADVTKNLNKNYVCSLCMHDIIPIYTFVSNHDLYIINDIAEVRLLKGASIELGYGAAFKIDDWTDLSDNSFTQMRMSKVPVSSIFELIVYTKLGKSLIRVLRNLLTMPVKFDPFEDMKPYFSYNILLNFLESSRKFTGYPHYVKDYIITKDSQYYSMNPYEDLMKDLEDYWVPF